MEGGGARSQVVWCGEHWLLYLRSPREAENSVSLSLYCTDYSSAGRGTAALVGIPGEEGFAPAMCTDNRDLAELIRERVVNWDVSPFPPDVPVMDAAFERTGDVRSEPGWRMESERGVLEARWSGIQPAFVMDSPLDSIGGTVVTHMALFFTSEAGVVWNGRPVPGRLYAREKWRRATGRPGSSCCFSLAETMVETAS